MTQRRNLARLLLVALVTLVVAGGGATAHVAAGPGDGAPTNGPWWYGDHMVPDGGSWTGGHMGAPGMMGGAVADGPGTSDCGGTWAAGMHGGSGGMMGGAGGWGATGPGTFGWFWPLVLVALTVGLGYVVLTRSGGVGRDRALEVLRERYARGELSDEEYTSRREALEG